MKKLLLFVLLLCGSILNTFAQQKVEFTPKTEYNSAFEAVYARHPLVPRGVLEAVAFQNTHLTHITPEDLKPSCTGMPPVYGIMGLMPNGKNWFKNNLTAVSQLSNMSPGIILSTPENSIEAYARAFEAKIKLMSVPPQRIEEYIDVILSLSELPDRNLGDAFSLDTYSYGILTFLQTPDYQQSFSFPTYQVDLEKFFGKTNYKVLSASFIETDDNGNVTVKKGHGLSYNPLLRRKNTLKDDTPYPMVADYSGAIWDPTTCNFSSRNGTAITHVTIHTMQGSYAGSISWFKNCTAQVSAHYMVRASDGQVTQMVSEADKGWHVGNSNPYAIGIENEGFVDDPTWYTTALYNANAAIVRDIATRRGFDLKRAYAGAASAVVNPISDCWIVKGHQHFASQSHTDPGIHWDWKRFYELLNPTFTPTVYTTATGTFTDPGGAGNYADRERRRYRISPAGARTVTVNFTAFNLENNYDFLRVYDGQNYTANLIGTYTGTTLPPTISGNTGHLYFEFDSDCATTAPGWSANWTSSTEPPACTAPMNLTTTFTGHSAATVGWMAVPGAVNYEVRFRRHFSNTWTTRTATTNSLMLTGLALNGHYYWQVRTNCSNNNYSTYATADFVTPNRANATINSCTGTFTDAGGSEGKYANSENWVTTVAPLGATSVTMTFTSFATANSSDYLKIYNGSNVNAPLLGTYHTNTSPGTVTGTTGALTLQFVSNASTVANGWVATWTCQNGGGCSSPTGPATTAVGQTTATLNWASVPNATSYEIRYRQVGDVTWTTTTTSQVSYNLSGLIANTQYEWQVRTNCNGTFSTWTASTTFTTQPSCNTSSGLTATSITTNSATISWNAVPGAISYYVQWRNVGGVTWSNTTVAGTSHNLTGLTAYTQYEWQVRTNCSGSQSSFTGLSNFMTLPLPCNLPTGLSTTSITENVATVSWSSVANALDYSLRYRDVGNANWTTITTATTTYNVTSLLASTNYEWQVQANCTANNSGFTASTNFTTLAPPACSIPTGTVTSNITQNSATLSWNAMPGAVNYRVIYRLSSDVNWTGVDVAGTSYNLTGLLSNSEYRWGVRTNCTSSSSSYSNALIFTTDLPPCNIPTGMTTTNITQTSATASWTAVSGAVNYTLQWRKIGDVTWSSTTLTGTSQSIMGLTANTSYEWQVRTNCAGNNSAYTASTNFTTLLPPCNVPTGMTTTSITQTSAIASWTAVSGAVNYTLQWKKVSDVTWSSTTLAGTSQGITGLTANTSYEWQVRTNCAGNNSAFTASTNFTTLIVCNTPSSLSTTNVSTTVATCNWGAVSGAVDYTLEYKTNASPTWTAVITTNTTYQLTGLVASTAYNWRIRANCGGGNNSAFASVQNFTTTASCTDANESNNSSTTATGLTIGTSKLGRICGAGDVDWFKVTLSATTNIRFTLSQLPLNYNLELYIGGTFVTGSYQSGTNNDVIIRNGQTANTLYYRVYGYNNVFDNLLDYQVLAETSPVAFKDENAVISEGGMMVQLYPNPATDHFYLAFDPTLTGSLNVQVVDMNGRTMYQNESSVPYDKLQIATSDWANGIYLIKVIHSGQVQQMKVVIQR